MVAHTASLTLLVMLAPPLHHRHASPSPTYPRRRAPPAQTAAAAAPSTAATATWRETTKRGTAPESSSDRRHPWPPSMHRSYCAAGHRTYQTRPPQLQGWRRRCWAAPPSSCAGPCSVDVDSTRGQRCGSKPQLPSPSHRHRQRRWCCSRPPAAPRTPAAPLVERRNCDVNYRCRPCRGKNSGCGRWSLGRGWGVQTPPPPHRPPHRETRCDTRRPVRRGEAGHVRGRRRRTPGAGKRCAVPYSHGAADGDGVAERCGQSRRRHLATARLALRRVCGRQEE